MMSRLKIAFILPDLGGGGAQRAMLTLARGLDPSRFSLHLIVIGTADEFAADVPAHATIERLGLLRLRQGMPALIRIVRSIRPKIIFTTMGYMNLALLAVRPLLGRDVNLVVREANVVTATLGVLPRWLPGKQLYAWLYPRAAAIIAQTNEIAKGIATLAPAAAARIVVLPNPLDESRHRTRAANPIRISEAGLVLVAAGRLTRQKGFDRLIALFPSLPPETFLTIFGEGPERTALELQVANLGLQNRVFLPGFSTDLPAAIAGADVFVLPSRWEGLPNVVLEALALGTPVVASLEAGVGDIAHAVEPGALTIAPVDSSFITAILARRPTPVRTPRPSLLPAHYQAETIAARFDELLTRVASAV